MAPVPPQPNYSPLAFSVAHVALALYLTFAVARSLYRSHLQLPPAQETRSRHSRRKHVVPVFAALAVASFAQAAYTAVRYLTLSYKAWAHINSTGLPVRVWGDKGLFARGEGSTLDSVSRWLADIPIYADASQILAERSRRFWWSQQFDLGLLSWTLLLAVEGRRRNIPFTWAYLGLAHMVSLSFAQNLFYIALLLTPTPMPPGPGTGLPASRYVAIRDRLFPPKPRQWSPHPLLLTVSYAVSAAAIFLTPSFVQSPLFTPLVCLARLSTFLPLAIPHIAPRSWGSVHSHPHDAYAPLAKLFRYVSVASAVLHAKATIWGLLFSRADDFRNRHSPFMGSDLEARDDWSRLLLGPGRIYEAASDHPIVGGASRDVLLSGLGLGLWAAIRGIAPDDILSCTVPFYRGSGSGGEALDYDPNDPHDARALLAGAVVKADDDSGSEAGDTISVATNESSSPTRTTRRRGKRGHSAKARAPDDANGGAVAALPPPRKRGRPRKNAGAGEGRDDRDADPTYQPSPAVRAAAVEGDEAMFAGGDAEWESAALAWGLAAAGGLGCASAGVFGGECISR